MSNYVIVPSPTGDGYVELARSKTGRLYKKQILHVGESFVHPNDPTKKIEVTTNLANKLIENFQNGACDIVQVPIVNGKNEHVEDPLRNLGEVVDLTSDDKGVYAIIDARKPELADELGKTLIGASAMMHLNYTDTKTGKHVGPTLLHVAVTNRPYITNLDGFEEIIAASRAQSADESDDDAPVVLTSTESLEGKRDMTKEELLALLKSEHGVDVAAMEVALSAKPAEKADDKTDELIAALSAVLTKAGAPVAKSEGGIEIADVAEAVIELSREKADLESTVSTLKAESDALKLSAAKGEVDAAVKGGFILPTQAEAMLEVRLSNPDLYSKLIPAEPVIEMSATGVDTHETPGSQKFDEEIERLSTLANANRSGRKR